MVRGAMMKEATPKAVFEGRRPDPAASFSQRLDAGRRSVRRRAQPRHEEAVEAARVGEQAGAGADEAGGVGRDRVGKFVEPDGVDGQIRVTRKERRDLGFAPGAFERGGESGRASV